jgi:hypothetical protein
MNALYTSPAVRWLLLVVCAIAATLGPFVFSAPGADDGADIRGLPLQRVAEVPLGGRPTRLDYASVAPDRHLLFVSMESPPEPNGINVPEWRFETTTGQRESRLIRTLCIGFVALGEG